MYVPAWPELRLRDLVSSGPLRPRPYPLSASRAHYAYVARSVIYHLFRALVARGEDVVLVPSYHHGNEVRAIRAAGAKIRFYPVGRDLRPDFAALDRLADGAHVLFLIHYIGFPQPIATLDAWRRRHGLALVEDCALAFLSECEGRSLGSFGDYAIFCLYKSLPLPNGGVLVENGRPLDGLPALRMRAPTQASVAGRTLELLLEAFRARHDRLGAALFSAKHAVGRWMDALRWRRLPVGDSGFDVDRAQVDMSDVCRRLLRTFDYEQVRERRRENFQYLAGRLAGRARPLRSALDNGACPLFFPILVKDKAAAARTLQRRGIGAVELWNEGDRACPPASFPETTFLRRHVLELPLHQSLSPGQLDYVADEVARLDGHL
jgi:dTDP-4-amino-4,6-dideoxygalactose transaminase